MIQTICDKCGAVAKPGIPAIPAVAAVTANPEATPPVAAVAAVAAVPAVSAVVVSHYTFAQNRLTIKEADLCLACEKLVSAFITAK